MALVLILAVGQEPTVLSTRCSVLRTAGYIALPTFTVAAAIDLFQSANFDLVLLCHSVPLQDRDHIIQAIRSTGSHAPIYAVHPATGDFQAGLADGTLPSKPEDLTRELGVLLGITPGSTALAACR